MANSLFAIFEADEPQKLKSRIEADKSVLSRPLSDGVWLIIAPFTTTTTELSDRLGISDGGSGAAIVVRVESYFGRAPSDVWEWIRAKMGAELAAQNA